MKLERLREWRQARGLEQRDVAAEAQISRRTVMRAEQGYSVEVGTARKVAEALGVEVADLLESPPVPLGQAPRPSGQEPKKSSQRRARAQETLDRTARRIEAEKEQEAPTPPEKPTLSDAERGKKLLEFIERVREADAPKGPPLEEKSDAEIAARRRGKKAWIEDTDEEVRLTVRHTPGEPLTIENMEVLVRRIETLEAELERLKKELREYAGSGWQVRP